MVAVAKRARLGELLVETGKLTREQLELALGLQRRSAGRLGEFLVASRALTEEQLASALAQQSDRPFMPAGRLFELEPPRELLRRLPRALAQELRCLPIAERDRTAWIASSEPETPEMVDRLRFALGVRAIRWMLVTPSALRSALAWAYR